MKHKYYQIREGENFEDSVPQIYFPKGLEGVVAYLKEKGHTVKTKIFITPTNKYPHYFDINNIIIVNESLKEKEIKAIEGGNYNLENISEKKYRYLDYNNK